MEVIVLNTSPIKSKWDLNNSDSQEDQNEDINEGEEEASIQIVEAKDERNHESFTIESSKGQKTSFTLSIKEGQEGSWLFGRGTVTFVDLAERKVKIADPTVSSKHFRLLRKDGTLLIIDLGSLHGTKINGESVGGNEEHRVNQGDCITVGSSRVRIRVQTSDESAFVDEDLKLLNEQNFACPICHKSLADLTPDERGAHINKCVDGEKSNGPFAPNSPGAGCPLCGKDLSKCTETQRLAHVNRCADELNPAAAAATLQKQQQQSRKAKESSLKEKSALRKLTSSSSTKKKVAMAQKEEEEQGSNKKKTTANSAEPKRFMFTKVNSDVIADEMRGFESDDEVFEKDESVLVKKRQGQELAKSIFAEDVKQMESVKGEFLEHLSTEKSVRAFQFSQKAETEPKRTRFPSPFRPTIRLSKEALLRRREYHEKQLELVCELLEATEERDKRIKSDHEICIANEESEVRDDQANNKRIWKSARINEVVVVVGEDEEKKKIDLCSLIANDEEAEDDDPSKKEAEEDKVSLMSKVKEEAIVQSVDRDTKGTLTLMQRSSD